MRTTLRIDDDLLRTLKQQAEKENAPVTDIANRALRLGLESLKSQRSAKARQFRQPVHDLGKPLIDLNKVNQFLAEEDVEEFVRKSSKQR